MRTAKFSALFLSWNFIGYDPLWVTQSALTLLYNEVFRYLIFGARMLWYYAAVLCA